MMQRIYTNNKRNVVYAVLFSVLLLIGSILPANLILSPRSVTAQAAQTQEAVTNSDTDHGSKSGSSKRRNVISIVVIAVIIGLFAVLYGLTNMASEKSRKNEVRMKIEKGSKDSE